MKLSANWFNKKLFFGFLFLVLLLAIIDWLIFGRTPMQEINTVKEMVSQKKSGEQASGFYGAAKAYAASATLAAQNFEPATANAEQFEQWFKSEAQAMNHYNVNEDKIQERYLRITAQMTPAQFKVLSQIAMRSNPNVSERILAAYLLGYAGYDSLSDLSALASSEIKLDGVPNAHTAAETQQTQERALRVLAINRLADLARGEDAAAAANALAELKKLIPTIKDANLKNYAQNKLKEISH